MNKKLIALAVAGACVAPAAMAGPVVLYGRVYETLESVNAKSGDGAAEVPRRTRVSDQASLLGVRGTEDLGGGLKAFFQLETAFKPDQNDSAFATRNSGVGLEGGWGSFVMGRWDMPYKVATFPIDVWGDLTLGGITGVGHDQGNFDRRDQNVLQYWSPNFAGFAFKLAATANEGKTSGANPKNPHDTGANVTYTRGPLYAFLAYEDHKDPSATVDKEHAWSGGVAYSFGPIKLGGDYEEFKRTLTAGGDAADKKSYLASVVWTMGANQLSYQYQHAKTDSSSSPECNSHTIGYKYIFTKRTFAMAQYTTVDNKNGATCNFGANTLAISPGNDPQGAAIGIQHVF